MTDPTNPRRPVNKASSRLRPSRATDATRRRTSRVTAGQRGADTRRDSDAPRTVAGQTDDDTVVTAGENTIAADVTPRARRTVTLPRMTLPKPALPTLRPSRSTRSAPSSWGLAIGLLAAAFVVTAVAVVAALRPGVEDGNRAFVDTSATQQVSAAGVNALKTIYSYDVKTIGGYKDAVHKVVTGKMLGDFDKFADTTVSAVQQAQSTATATPDPVGVTLLTSDRAELLVDLTVAATKNGVPQESASGPIVLRMQKVNGHWLASEIADR